MATGIKFCMSSTLHRPDSRKTSNSPDAGMLRKLVRDRNCRPVFRGILESLLHYLTQALPKWTTRNRHPGKPGSDIVVERNIDWPDQRIEASMEQTQIKTSCTFAQLPGKHKTTQEKTAETSSKTPEKCWSDPQKDRLPSRYVGTQKTGDLKPRRLTTFQLLQSKFIRSTPKPPITHQREVGTLSSSRGAGDLNHCQCSESNMHTKNQTRREQGLKKGGSVKDIVAKFAMAEHREKGENMLKKQPLKPRLIGRGAVLSSLMERFETMATVCKGSALKCSHEFPSGGVKVTSNVKQRVVCHERRHQQAVDPTDHKQNQPKQIKSKSVGLPLKGNKTTNGQEQRPARGVDIFTKINSNLEEKNYLEAEQMRQMRDEHSDQTAEGQCSFKHIKPHADDKDVKGWRSEEYGEIQTTAEETSITNKLKYGHLELLSLTSVTESMLPEPYRLFPQVEPQMNWHVGTVMNGSPVWSTCADSSPKLYSVEPSESTVEPATAVTDGRCPSKPQPEGLSTYTGCNPVEDGAAEDVNLAKAETIPRRLPEFLIPRVYRFDYSQVVADQTDSLPLSAPQPENINPLVASPPPEDTSMTAFNTRIVTCPPNYTKEEIFQTTKEKQTEVKPQDKEGDAKELTPVVIKDTNMPQSFRLPEETANQAAFEGSETSAVTSPKIHPGRDNQKWRPKYTTINYGDPSVKQTYKPKIIRFTDTFTF